MRGLMRTLVGALAMIVIIAWTALPAEAALCPPGCGGGQGSVECKVCDKKPPKPGKPTKPGKPSLPYCPPTKDAVPDDGYTEHPDDWVLTRCMEGSLVLLFWVPRTVDPRVLALSLLDSMDLKAIDIGMVPREGPDYVGTVGAPVWMWVDDPTPTTWGPNTISAGGVSMTARVTKVVWDMGDGHKVTCQKGTVWTKGDGIKKSPTCGHVYEKRGKVDITATTYWRAHWSGYGQSGDFYFQLENDRSLQVTEVQVVVTNR